MPAPASDLPEPEFLRDADRAREAYLVRIGKTEQSYVDLDDPTHLEFDYVQRMADVIDLVAEPGQRIRMVHIGGAGMTLPRYVAHTRPASLQVVLEPDTALTERVRERLPLPRNSGIKVRAVDGRSGIAALRDRYCDVVVLDAFHGARVPAELTTTSAIASYRRVLDERGVLIVNLTDKGLAYARRVAAGICEQFSQVVLATEPATLKGRRFGNVVITAADRRLDLDTLTRHARRAPFPYRVVHDAELQRLIGAAQPFTDSDAEPSPQPPDRTLFW